MANDDFEIPDTKVEIALDRYREALVLKARDLSANANRILDAVWCRWLSFFLGPGTSERNSEYSDAGPKHLAVR